MAYAVLAGMPPIMVSMLAVLPVWLVACLAVVLNQTGPVAMTSLISFAAVSGLNLTEAGSADYITYMAYRHC